MRFQLFTCFFFCETIAGQNGKGIETSPAFVSLLCVRLLFERVCGRMNCYPVVLLLFSLSIRHYR